MAKFNYSRVKRDIETARQYDQYLAENLDAALLKELNNNEKRGFFERQVREMHFEAAKLINNLWELNVNLDNTDTALDNVGTALEKKLKKDPQVNFNDTIRSLNSIFNNQSLQIQDFFKNFKDEIAHKTQKERISNLVTPFKNLWQFISLQISTFLVTPFKNLWQFISLQISTLYHSVTLNAQVQSGIDFQNIEQSTHLPSVHKSIKLSLDKLEKRHPLPADKETLNQLEHDVKTEIENHIKQINISPEKKNYAFNTLERANDDRAKEPRSGRTIMNTLIIIWTAAKDSTAYEGDDSKEAKKSRMNNIIEHLALADREYNLDTSGKDMGGPSAPACLGGTVNKIVESLEIIHPDVQIIRGTDILADIAIETFEAEFKKLRSEQQVLIYKGGGDELKEGIVNAVKQKLDEINRDIFSGDVPAQKIKNFVNNLEYLVLPQTEAIKSYEAKKESANTQASLSDEQPEQPSKKITVDGHEITKEDTDSFKAKFEQMKKIPLFKSQPDEQIAKRIIKQTFDEGLWDKNDNLDQLAKALLEEISQVLIEDDRDFKEKIGDLKRSANPDDPEASLQSTIKLQ